MLERTQRTGHFHLWTNNPILAQRRDQFERDYHRRDFVYQIYSRAYQKMQQEGIIDKIQDYYAAVMPGHVVESVAELINVLS
jgi:hypothetical protein